MLTLKFYNAVDFAEANLITPESKDFWLEQNGKQQNSREIINGRAYKVTTVKYFFTPLVAGKIDIEGSHKGLAIPRKAQEELADDAPLVWIHF